MMVDISEINPKFLAACGRCGQYHMKRSPRKRRVTMEEKRKKERRETRVKVIGFGVLSLFYLVMALRSCWDQRAGLGILCAIMAAVCAGGVILEREVRNAAEYCEDMELALDLLRRRGGVGPDECVIYLEEAVGVLCSPEEHIRLWAKSGGGTACVWKGEARRLPTELRKLPLLRFSGRAPEETEVIGYLEIETELPEGWKLREETGETDSHVAALLGMTEKKAAEKERMVCPHCGGRAHHTVGGKEFCSLCLEEMRRE